MDYKEFLDLNWADVHDIGERLMHVSDAVFEQKQLSDAGKEIDMELIKDRYQLFLSDVNDLVDIRDEMDWLE